MHTSTAKEQRISPTKYGVHGEVGAIRHGLLRRETAQLGTTVRSLEKERRVLLNSDKKSRDGLLQKMYLLQSKLGMRADHKVLHDRSNTFSSPRPLSETPREFSKSLPGLWDATTPSSTLNENDNCGSKLTAMNRPSTALPRQRKISRQRLEELSRPKSAISHLSSVNQLREAKKRRSSKQEMVKVNRSQQERIDVNRSPMSTPSDSPKLIRTRKKSTVVAPNLLELLVSDDLTQTDSIATTQCSTVPVYRKSSSSSSFELALDRVNGRGGSTGDSNHSMSSNSPIVSGRTSPTSSSSVFDDTESTSTTPRSIMRTPGPRRSPNSPRKSITFALDFELTATPGRRFSCHNLPCDRDTTNPARTRKISAQSNLGQRRENSEHEYQNYWTWEALTRDLDKCRYLRRRDDFDSNDDIIDIGDIFDKSD